MSAKNNNQRYLLTDNVAVEVKVRYVKQNNKNVREWYTNNLTTNYDGKNYSFDEVVLVFGHIDSDNPEFFLQPGQKVKVLGGNLNSLDTSVKNNVLTIDKFQQLSDKTQK
ncbi:hypothetical protein [Candidatus Phytoplasma pruni]|uniref:Uncharacterized protein n=1 Tax=Candidatus Phytoplasma pruni TaxID=479893 RepID=A0A851HKI1_9MOLU|nr:hypothetical protein [Candidatus Phytoplasma pruni]NWN46016.1 hypothetical protein [Candidatus Phytoplasma pruni]